MIPASRSSTRLSKMFTSTCATSKCSGDLDRIRCVGRLLHGYPDAAAALMKPANEDVLTERVVSKAVGNVRNNGPELLN
jgi:hypothetical protein